MCRPLFSGHRLILRELDPDGMAARLSRRLEGRTYTVPGPNFIWHIDGYFWTLHKWLHRQFFPEKSFGGMCTTRTIIPEL